ncbi:MAG: type II toxin-antitoxin system HicA family toxin [Candidatus Gracilibacteria bacterium]
MTKIEKRLKKFFRNPDSLKYYEIETLLYQFGFQKLEAKGSHTKFILQNPPYRLIIPIHGHDCKPFYKIKTARILKILCDFK